MMEDHSQDHELDHLHSMPFHPKIIVEPIDALSGAEELSPVSLVSPEVRGAAEWR